MAVPQNVWFPGNFWSFSRFRSLLCSMSVGLYSLTAMLPATVQAADVSPQQQEIIDNLMKALTISKGYNSTIDAAPTSARTSDTKEIVLMRQVLSQVTREADRLVDELRNSLYSGIPGMSQIFGQALTLKSDLKVLTDRANVVRDHRELQADLETLDQDWRALAYTLQETRGISQNAKQSVRIINDYATQISGTLNVEPQLNRRELQRQATILEEQLRNLNNDVRFELGHTDKINELIQDGGKVRSDAQRMSEQIASGNSYNEIVLTYKQFKSLWLDFVNKLHRYDNRYIERDIMNVYQTDSELVELLWIPKQADWAQLTELAYILHRDVTQLFDDIKMSDLMTLSKPQEAIKTGRIYRDLCESFKRRVSEQTSEAVLSDEFQKLDTAWKIFANDMLELKGSETWNRMKMINNSIVSLRSALLIKPANYDNDALVESASNLESMADHLQYDMERWLNSSAGSSVPRRREYLNSTNQFVANSRDFHNKLVNGNRNQQELKQISADLLSRWLQLLGGIGQCNTLDRDHLNRTAQEITAELVKIQSQMSL